MRRFLTLSLVLSLGACNSLDEPLVTEDPKTDGSTVDTSVGDGLVDDTGGGDTGGGDATAGDTGAVDTSVADTGAGDVGADASPSCSSTPAPAVEKLGPGTGVLLKGTVVTPDTAFAGEVLVEGDTITCVAASCSASMPATTTIVQTNGMIFPGLIDTHNHILFDVFDESDWTPTKAYGNHDQWPSEPRYSAMVDAKQYLNGEGSPWSYGCEMNKYGELKGLVAGTTSIAGAANPANKACYGTLARTIDQSPNGLPGDKIQVATLFPTKSSADGVCDNFADGSTDAYLIHIAEGVDTTAFNEFAKLRTITTTPDCLLSPKTTIVHGTALGDAELTLMGSKGMSLSWSPKSNVFLYGAGTDLTKTTNIPLAISKGINVALSPDWSLGGSQNLLDELRFANHVDDTVWGNKLDAKTLVKMVTTNAAKALGLSSQIGSIEVGKKADLMVIGGNAAAPYDALLAATPRDVRLVMVNGMALYGDMELKTIAQATPACETLDVCCASKFVCVAASGGGSTNKWGQTYAEITSALSKALTDYDALGLTSYKFAPLAPLVKCP